MAQILVRGLEPEVVERLKRRARDNDRSLQGEVAQILREAARRPQLADARPIADKWRAYFGARVFSENAALIREDRDR